MSWKNFAKCGVTGWCLEIIFTSFAELPKGNLQFIGTTSLWMFPIYGMAVFLVPVYEHIKHWPTILRGFLYGLLIISGEFLTGTLLKFFHVCPWDYSGKLLSFHGVIRLDYFPFWFAVGLIYEQLLCSKPAKPPEAGHEPLLQK